MLLLLAVAVLLLELLILVCGVLVSAWFTPSCDVETNGGGVACVELACLRAGGFGWVDRVRATCDFIFKPFQL